MPPEPWPSPQRHGTTIRSPQPGSNADQFLSWADHRGCSAAAVRLLNALLASETSTQLGSVVDLVSVHAGLLEEWESAGGQTYGLAELAALLGGQEVLATPGARRVNARPAIQDLPGQSVTHYLQLSLICRRPRAAEQEQLRNFDRLRIWLLVEALQRAEAGNRQDELLKAVADGIRHAGEELGSGPWVAPVVALAPPSRSLTAVRLYLISRASGLRSDKKRLPPQSTQAKFLAAVEQVASGLSRPVPTAEAEAARWLPVEDLGPSPRPSTLARAADDQPQVVDVPADGGAESDGDGETGSVFAAVDPDESTGTQEARSRYIHLVSAAKARFARWSWDVINPNEQTALQVKVAEAYGAHDVRFGALAALVDLCTLMGRSLAGTLAVRVLPAEQPANDWTLDIGAGRLRRPPVRRSLHTATLAKMQEHLRPQSSGLERLLPERCQRMLERLAKLAGSRQLRCVADLWPDLAITPSQAFADWLRTNTTLWRVTPGMLGTTCERDLYDTTKDWLRARLLGSPADVGLPAAAAYCAYTSDEIVAVTAGWFVQDPSANAAGSLIDAAEDFYRNGFARATAAIDAAADGDFVAHHNLVSLFWDAALRAGTGTRPINGLWRWSRIDFDEQFAFTDDKTGLDESAARWIPLPSSLVQMLQESYVQRHLPMTLSLVRSRFGPDGDAATEELRKGLVWLEVEDGKPKATPIGTQHRKLHDVHRVDYPLVTNALRHRARTVWRRHGCDQEVIDSLMGHSDGATRTHGDFSPRTWKADMAQARPLLEAAYESLGIKAPAPFRGPLPPSDPIASSPLLGSASFDLVDAARSLRRWRTLLAAARTAAAELTAMAIRNDPSLAPRVSHTSARLPLRTLLDVMPTWSAEHVTQVVKTLMTTGSGTPATLGPQRLAFLSHLADSCWHATGQPFRLNRKLFRGFLRDDPRATPAGISAAQRVAAWRRPLASIRSTLDVSTVKPIEAAALLVTSLMLESRVADQRLLADAVRGRMRIIRLDGRHYIEWSSDAILPANGHGVVRHRATSFAASMAGVLLQAPKLHFSHESNAPAVMRPLLAEMGLSAPASMAQLMEVGCATVDALNCLELPGNVAAARAGRFLTASRSWPDWTRRADGSYLAIDARPRTASDVDELAGSEPTDALPSGNRSSSGDSRGAARAFSKAVRSLLNTFRRGGIDAKISPSQRRDLARRVEQACREHEVAVSPALLLLGKWCHSLFDRQLQGGLVRPSTIRRYFSALSPRFEALAHDVDLQRLDTDEMTGLFAQLLEMRSVDRPSYVLARLREFDRYCATFGTSSPDWSELNVEDIGIGISPGYLDERAYLRAFDRLGALPDAALARQSRLMALFGYRFGLRGAETAALRVKDVVGFGPSMHVVVERLKSRDTKSDHGRRTVPLLFLMSHEERSFLDAVMSQAAERARLNPNAPLLADPAQPAAVIDADTIAKVVAQTLKSSTGNTALSEHHLRHSFACRLWHALEVPIAEMDASSALASQRVRAILLNDDRINRQAPWALAGVLGHGHPSRAYRSYIHFLCERADQLLFADNAEHETTPCWPNLVDLDLLPRRTPVDIPRLEQRAPSRPTIDTVILCVRMLATKVSSDRIAASVGVAHGWLEELDAALRGLSAKLGPSGDDAQDPRFPKLASSGLLSHLLRSSMPRLQEKLAVAVSTFEMSTPLPEPPSVDDLVGMVGYRRQLSVWSSQQMTLARSVVENLKVERGRLSLLMPARLSALVLGRAEAAGLIGSPGEPLPDSDVDRPRVFPLMPIHGRRQEPASFGSPPMFVKDRLSIELLPREGQGIGNRFELIFCLLCIWAWLMSWHGGSAQTT